MAEKITKITINLPQEYFNRLEYYCREDRVSLSEIALDMIIYVIEQDIFEIDHDDIKISEMPLSAGISVAKLLEEQEKMALKKTCAKIICLAEYKLKK